jgi:ATP-dependent DNA helicase RecG
MSADEDLFTYAHVAAPAAAFGIQTQRITLPQAQDILRIEEGQFSDLKAIDIAPAKLSKTIAAFANTDGGDLYIGVFEDKVTKTRKWQGFENAEAANGHLQLFEKLFPLGTDFLYEFLRADSQPGLVLHVQINKTRQIMKASNGLPYIRRGAQSLPVDNPEAQKHLEYVKGLASFEEETTNVEVELLTQARVTNEFTKQVVPTAQPEVWLRKQALIRNGKPTVAGVLLFCDEPQAQLPKRCGIKLYRYKTNEAEGFRSALDGTPETVEGCLYDQIRQAVKRTTDVVESVQKMGDRGLESVKYPPETVHEIITNAVLHRDYSVADDVHIRIFDNRIEVQSPGRLPAHVTVDNILDERLRAMVRSCASSTSSLIRQIRMWAKA